MRTVQERQLYRDLAPDMRPRDRRLRVRAIGDDGRAECVVEHDTGLPPGRVAKIQVKALANPSKFELLEDTDDLGGDPRYTALLDAMVKVHGSAATPLDYTRAAWEALGLDREPADQQL